MTYKIIRFRFQGRNKTIKTGLTLEEAQAHCRDPETNSRTCKKPKQSRGVWFDGYAEE